MELLGVTPVLRVFDVPLAKSFYVDYLGCSVDWEEGSPEGPTYLQVSRAPGEHMLSTELIDPFANLIRFFERGVDL
jgi:catechol 2,3-dioxygenase-like lactoylglutathione lyase family enzyme